MERKQGQIWVAGVGVVIIATAVGIWWVAGSSQSARPSSTTSTPQAKAAIATVTVVTTATPTISFVAVGSGPTPRPGTPISGDDAAPATPANSDVAPTATELATNQPTDEVTSTPSEATALATATTNTAPPSYIYAPTAIPFAGGVEGGSWQATNGTITYKLPEGADSGDVLGPVAQLSTSSSPASIAVSITSKYGEDCGIAVGDPATFTLVRLRGGKTATFMQLDTWQGEGNFATPTTDALKFNSPYIGQEHQLLITVTGSQLTVKLDDQDTATTASTIGKQVSLYAGGDGCAFHNFEVRP